MLTYIVQVCTVDIHVKVQHIHVQIYGNLFSFEYNKVYNKFCIQHILLWFLLI